MRKLLIALAVLTAPLLARGASTINATNHYAWGANIGWTNWLPSATDGIVIGEFVCSGYVWAANVGWISLGNGTPANGIQYSNTSGTDFGVNYGVDLSQPNFAVLRGFAYGANIGWINFEPTGNPRLNLMTGGLEGYAWSANCGWINLGDSANHFLVTDRVAMGADSDGDGIADAFELLYTFPQSLTAMNATTDTDGDGMSDLNEYLEGTNPTSANDRLRITSFTEALSSPGSQAATLTFTTSPARLYRIETSLDLNPLSWVDSGLGVFAPTAGSASTQLVIHPAGPKRFFRVRSIRPLP